MLVAATVICVVLGSSSVAALVGPGKKLRWIALLALAVAAVTLAGREIRAGSARPPQLVLLLGGWLAALGLVSTVWSVDPRLTFGRAASFALLFLAAGALSLAAGSRPELSRCLVLGVLSGAVAAAVAGVLMLAFAHADAVQPASRLYPARFRGLGENPDTVAMLEGLAVPMALWVLLQARRSAGRLAALGSLLLFLASISASGSRGGLLAAVVGGLALSASLRVSLRQRLVVALAVCLAVGAAVGGTQIPKPLAATPVGSQGQGQGQGNLPPALATPGTAVGGPAQGYSGRLSDELFRIAPGPRSLLSSSGRLQAVYEAIRQGDSRPLLGFGFGTEDRVYVDRVYNFQGSYVENSFAGFYLQAGAIGVLSLLALLAAVCSAAIKAVRSADRESAAPALTGVIAAGLALMLVQSYVYSVGNVATVSFWAACLVVAARVPAREPALARPPREEGVVAAA